MSKIKAIDILKRPFQRLIRPALITVPVVAILIALLVLQPWASPGPERLIAEAYAATESLQSYRIDSSITNTFEGETVEASSEMEFAAPDRYHGKMTVDGETHEFIIIGDKQYTRERNGTQSGTVYGISMSGSILSKEDTLELLDTLTDLEKLPDEEIKGIDCLHYQGRVNIARMIEAQMANLDPEQPGYEEIKEALEQQLEWQSKVRIEVELWVGSGDYLIRQMKNDMKVPRIPPEPASGEPQEWDTSSSIVRYYDFNEPITIEPPLTASGELLPGWRLVGSFPKESTFSRDVTFTIGGDDPAHQRISFRIAITNISEEVASNVRVTVHTMATNEESKSIKMEAEPSTPGPINLQPGESETYRITWEYDAIHTSKDELARLVHLTTILAKYTTPEGEEATQLLFPDAPYPSKPPPERPPSED